MPLLEGGAGEKGAMADRRDGGVLFVAGIGKDRAFGQQELEAGVVVAAEAGQVVVAELVDDHGQHQLGARRSGSLSKGGDEGDEDPQQAGTPGFAHTVHDIRLGGYFWFRLA
jgi:hypothetical protein